MINKIGIRILLIIGIGIACSAVSVGYVNIRKGFSYETAEGLVTGFHTHHDHPGESYPNVAFIYKGDSVFCKIDYVDSSIEVGATVTVIFPPGDPESADIDSSLWFVPLFLLFFSGFFILPALFAIPSGSSNDSSNDSPSQLKVDKIPEQQTSGPSIKSATAAIIGRLILTAIAGLLVWLVVYEIQLELSDEYSSTGWSAIVVLGLVGLIFSAISLAAWIGAAVEPFMIDVDADFVNVTSSERTLSATGEARYKWNLECKWNDPRSGRQFTFKSAQFEGKETFYNRSKIRVSVLPSRPRWANAVDLSFVSQTNHSGITLVDSTLVSQVEEAELRLKAHREKLASEEVIVNDTPLKRTLRPVANFMMKHRRLIDWGFKLSPFLFVLAGGLWWFLNKQLETYRDTAFEKSMIAKIGSRPWKFESVPGRKANVEVNGLKVSVRSSSWRFSGETMTIPWAVDTYINSRSGRMVYEGYTPSEEEKRLDQASVTQWKSGHATLPVGEVLLIAEIPGTFPEEAKQQLLAPFVADSTSFLGDLILSPHISVIGSYFNTLLRGDYNKLFKKKNIERYVYENGSSAYVIVTNNRKVSDYFLAHNFWSAYSSWKKTLNSDAAILVSEEGFMVATLAIFAEPAQLDDLNDFCVGLDEKIIRAKYNDDNGTP